MEQCWDSFVNQVVDKLNEHIILDLLNRTAPFNLWNFDYLSKNCAIAIKHRHFNLKKIKSARSQALHVRSTYIDRCVYSPFQFSSHIERSNMS